MSYSFLAQDRAFQAAQRAYDNRMPPEDGPDYGEWLEKRQLDVLASDPLLMEEYCWESLGKQTLEICLAFAWVGMTGQHRPFRLTRGYIWWCAACTSSDQLIDKLECGDIPSLDVLEIAVLASDNTRSEMPSHLRDVCNQYRDYVLAASVDWGWMKGEFDSEVSDKKRGLRLEEWL